MSDLLKRCVHRLLAIRRLPARVRAAWPGVAAQLLTAALLVVYFVVLTPLGIMRRVLRGRSLVRPVESRRGWLPIRQSSADKQIYLSDY